MTKTKKLIFISAYSLLGLLLIFGVSVYSLYRHPGFLIPYIVESVARRTDADCRIQDLSISSRPWHIQIKGLSLTPKQKEKGFELSVPALDLDLEFAGAFGRKTLVIRELRISNPDLKINEAFDLPKLIQESEKPGLLERAFKYFFFREIAIRKAKVANGDVALLLTGQTCLLKDLQAEWTPDHLLEITCGGEWQLLNRGITLILPQVHLATEQPLSDPSFKTGMHLQIPDATLEGSDLRIAKLVLDARFQYLPEQKRLDSIQLDVQIERILFKEFKTANPLKLHFNLNGDFNLNDFGLHVPHWTLGMNEMDPGTHPAAVQKAAEPINDLFVLQGSLESRLLPDAYLGLKILEGKALTHKLLALAPLKLKKMLADWSVSGPIRIGGRLEGRKKGEQWQEQCDLTATFHQNPVVFAKPEFRLSMVLNGTIQAQGPWLAPLVTAKLETINMLASVKTLKAVEIEPFQGFFILSGTWPIMQIHPAIVKIPGLKWKTAAKEWLWQAVEIQTSQPGQMDGAKASLSLPEMRLSSSSIQNLLMDLSIRDRSLTLGLHGQNMDLWKAGRELKLLPAGWRSKGWQDVEVQAAGDATYKKWHFAAKIKGLDNSFEDPQGNWVGEKIQAELSLEGNLDLDAALIEAQARLDASEGEALLDRFYFNLKTNPISCSSKADYRYGQHVLALSETRMFLKDILSLDLKGQVNVSKLDCDLLLQIPATGLQPLFEHFIRAPFKTEKPFLADLIVGGNVSTSLNLKKQGANTSLKGRFQWQAGSMAGKGNGLEIKELNLDYPVWFTTPSAKAEHGNLKGKLTVRSLKGPWLPEQPLNLVWEAGPNQIHIPSPGSLKIKGGHIELGPLDATNIYSGQPRVDTSLNLRSLDLQPFLSGFWGKASSGNASGRLTKIVFDGRSLSSQGKIKADLFGGEIIVSNPGLDKAFGSHPVLALNSSWENLNLLEMTKDTAFGAIQGTLQGYMKNLEIAAGQPQKFDLLIETTPKKGTTQKISLRAVDNIARIGGGQSPFIGMAVVYAAFIQELPYKKIGIKAVLENDTFRINGTTKEGGKEYLIAKGGWMGVNIVNQTPGLPISFKDMLPRIKEVFSGTSAPKIR